MTVFSADESPPDACYIVRKVLSSRPSDPVRAWLWLWQLASRYAAQDFSDFDIIHAHGNNVLLLRPGRPVVRTLHGAALGEAIHATTWKRGFWYLTLTPPELWEAARATRVVAVSANTRQYVPGVEHVIPNSVDREVFFPGPKLNLHHRHRHPVILFVGTLAGRKRGRMLLELFQSQIRPALPDAELWMVAERNVQASGVVSFPTPDERTLADLYRRAWVFCLPSTYEGFGVPYIEALACGTPVVATPNVGAREVLEEGRWGILASPNELGAVLLSLLQDTPRRQRLAQQGLEGVAEFEQTRVVDSYESLFEETIRCASG